MWLSIPIASAASLRAREEMSLSSRVLDLCGASSTAAAVPKPFFCVTLISFLPVASAFCFLSEQLGKSDVKPHRCAFFPFCWLWKGLSTLQCRWHDLFRVFPNRLRSCGAGVG